MIVYTCTLQFCILQRVHYFLIIMEVVVQFPLCWNLGRCGIPQGMNNWGEESITCEPYFILSLNRALLAKTSGLLTQQPRAAGSLPIEKLSNYALFFFLIQLPQKSLLWIYLRINGFITHCPPCLNSHLKRMCPSPLATYLDHTWRNRALCRFAWPLGWSWATHPCTIPCSTAY